MAKEVLYIPEDHLREVVNIIRNGIKATNPITEEVKEALTEWCDEEEAYLNPMTQTLKNYLEKQGYYNLTEIPGRGICGLSNFMFTTGIIYGMTNWTYKGRYCYETAAEAETALRHWTGEGHPPGLWVKHKGEDVEESNPLNKEK